MKSKQILLIIALVSSLAFGVMVSTQSASALECSLLPDSICNSAGEGELEESGVWKLLIFGFNILTAGVGIVAVGAIIYAGFLYTTAQDKADQTKKAMEMIRNTAIGLLLFIGMFAIVNFLVPGGIFNTSGGGGGGGGTQPPCGPSTGKPCPK